MVVPPAIEADWIVELTDTYIKFLNNDGTLTVLNVPTGGLLVSESALLNQLISSIEHQNADGSTASSTVTGVNVTGFIALGALYTFFQPIILAREVFAGDDILIGGAGIDYLSGGAGDDTLTGGAGNIDNFEFKAGDGNWGHDTITDFDTPGGERVTINQTTTIKGYSDLVFSINAIGDAVASAGGNSITFKGVAVPDLSSAKFYFPIYGNNNDNILISGANGDFMDGDDGNDAMYGYGGNDDMYGGDGDDLLKGGDGNDTMHGDDQSFFSVPGADTLFGGKGNDTMHGDGGDDFLYGEGGDDIMSGDDGNDRVVGGTGNDTMNGNGGDDILKGKDGIDTMYGDQGIDILFGDLGDDSLSGGSENDFLYGGRGEDTLNGDDGDDRLRGNLNNDTLNGGGGNDRLFGGGNADILHGDDGDDVLVGENHADVLDGGAGDDILFGNLNGGAADGDADMFRFKPGNEVDRVRDFEDGVDHIDLSLFGFASTTDAMANATQTGWGAVKFNMGGGDIMYVENMTLGVDFTDADIII